MWLGLDGCLARFIRNHVTRENGRDRRLLKVQAVVNDETSFMSNPFKRRRRLETCCLPDKRRLMGVAFHEGLAHNYFNALPRDSEPQTLRRHPLCFVRRVA